MQRGDKNGGNNSGEQQNATAATGSNREGVVVSVIPQSGVLQPGTIQQYTLTEQQLQALTSGQNIGVVQSLGGSGFTLQTATTQHVPVQPPSQSSSSRLVSPVVQTLITPGSGSSLSASDLNSVLQQQLASNIVNVTAINPQSGQQSNVATTVHLVTGAVSTPQRTPLSSSSVSPSGGTIHHHGQSPTRGGQPPLSNLQQNRLSMSINQQAQQLAQKRSIQGGAASNPGTPVSSRTLLDARHSPHPIGALTSPPSRVVTTPTGQPPRKKLKLEEKPPATPEVGRHRKMILDQHYKTLSELKENCIENLTELFFLQHSGNMMDFHQWKKRPTPQLVQFLKSSSFDSDEEEEHLQEKRINDEVKVLTSAGSNVPLATPIAISTTLPPSVSALSQLGSENKLIKSGQSSGSRSPGSASGLPVQPTAVGELTTTVDVSLTLPSSVILSTATPTSSSSQLQIHLANNTTQPLSIKTTQSLKTPLSSPGIGNSSVKLKSPPLSPRQHTRQQSISAVYDSSIGSQEAIVERAKQEAQVMQRVAEMRREGLWSSRRLPKVHEPARNKAHWDYLLEEMQWLATDFVQERKWKKAACRKIARMVAKYHQDIEQKEVKAEKEEALKVKRIASQMAKQIKEFWSNIEKVVQYKQQSRQDERKKKALDVHLNFIVDQTEKYSSWLTETLHQSSSVGPSSVNGSISSPAHSSEGDMEFEPVGNATDDEETIEKEENESGQDDESTQKELEELQKESELPIEDLLKTLPSEVLDTPASLPNPGDSSSDEEEKGSDSEFKANKEDERDVEDTIEEQEKHEKNSLEELNELQAEGEMSIEELVKKYAGAYDSDFEMPEGEEESDDSTDEESEESAKESSSSEEGEEEDEEDKMESDVGLDFLLKSQDEASPQKPVEVKEETGPGKEITDAAAEALSLQPKGYTLETTEVKTKVPFLLKHTLREYQHVGLDWLATMYTKRLNGILADEMGLGKTIQTISVLSHLACEKGIWGPHLIVVPTSVMLNWEIELKKWCPAFKILTYYGSQKERKQKRTGWTKTNAFHVCITSYKLVIQDHAAFRRKKWKYLILDEAQNIKNFKSQRWQMLLNFQSQRRLLLTGTPLQNSLMELWSLMHFLMPHVFQSHKEFKEWFANPLTGMVEGSQDYNEGLVKRLHKVLRPFLLRRLKDDVEKQMPKKYEHVVMCKLSKRQRYLYDEFMGQTKTRETLNAGDFLSVINVLMQLRKVCNHPNLFDPRPIVSPFQMEGIVYNTASLVLKALQYDPFKEVDLRCLYPSLSEMELDLPAFVAHRVRKLQTPGKLIEEIDDVADPPPRPKPGRLKNLNFRSASPAVVQPQSGRASPLVLGAIPNRSASPVTMVRLATPTSRVETSPSSVATPTSVPQSVRLNVIPSTSSGGVKVSTSSITTGVIHTTAANSLSSQQPITVQIQQTQQGTRLMIPTSQFSQLPAGLIQIVQTSTGQHLISTTSSATSTPVQHVAPVQNSISGVNRTTIVTPTTVTSATPATQIKTLPVQLPSGSIVSTQKPVMRVPPLTSVDNSATSTTPAATSATRNLSSLSTVTAAQAASAIAAIKTNEPQPSSSPAQPVPVVTRRKSKPIPQSELHLKALKEKREKHRKSKLELIAKINKRHCDVKPVYGRDLCESIDAFSDLEPTTVNSNIWHGLGTVHCRHANRSDNSHRNFWKTTSALSDIVHTPEQYLTELQDLLERYVFVTPPVTVPSIKMHVSHPPPSYLLEQSYRDNYLRKELSVLATPLHWISSRMQVMFPEVRLIQYDCGKLQTLDRLLARLKSGQHRVLIFTQMTKMLDVLESFLNYHGHRYLRLDGTTKVEQRQVLMDRFNADKRIFVFILSTRSGGIGVNLTGADTVIFYDSDWNPTMDAQAQDRCHRIGQTRDVHIYRLISDKTIEENILKKANQKRLLGDLAIEGGNFTTAFFKQQTLKELFEEPSGLESLADQKNNAKDKSEPMEVEKVREVETSAKNKPDSGIKDSAVLKQFEMALCKAEDETDVIAAKQVQAEQKAELAEFDESIPWDEKEQENRREEDEVSKVELELAQIDKELSPIERYAVGYVEAEMEPDEDSFDEDDIENAKKDWELARLKALKEEEERRAEMEEDEMLYTYSVEDSQLFISDLDEEIMPMWAPPTPPQDDNDVYIDNSLLFLYEPNIMSESQLPPVYIRKEHKKPRIETVTTRKQKQRKEEPPRVPRSLFDRPTAIQQKLRREAKMQKLKQGLVKPFRPSQPLLANKTVMEPQDQDIPEWLIHEDWALLQAVQSLLNLPLNLQVVSPAVIINWDLVSDVVNSCSRVYRTPKMCKFQYENVIIPREEGRILYDVSPRKQKKQKGIYKSQFPTKNNRPMRTSHLYLQNGTTDLKSLYCSRFDLVKNISTKRPPPLRQTLANPTLRNPKHAAVLEENGISYDKPLDPLQVATNRAERIAREKKQSQAAAQVKQAAEQLAAQRSQAAAQATVTVGAAVSAPTIAQAVQAQQLQPLVTGATTVMQSGTVQKLGQNVTAVSIARTIGGTGNIIVNTPGIQNFATITKGISRAVTVTAQPTSIAVTSALGQTVRAGARPIELTAITTGGQTPQVAGQTRATLQAGTNTTIPAQRIATLTAATVQQQLAQAAMAKGLSPQHLNMIRQQQSIVRQQNPQLRQQKFSITADSIRHPVKRLQNPLAGQKVITTLQMGQKAGMIQQLQRQQQQQQQQRLLQVQQKPATSGATTVGQGQITVQGTSTQHPTAQIIAQTQGVNITPGTSQAPVVTLVKSASAPSPVNISVNVGQQKHVLTTRGGTATPLTAVNQKLVLTKRGAQLQAAHKAQLQKGQIPVLIPNQKLGQPLSSQQILQHLVKHQGASISQLIPQNIIPVSSTGQPTQMITKVCIATTAPSSQIQTLVTAASPVTVTPVPPASAGQIQTINVSSSSAASIMKTSIPSSQVTTMQVRTVPSSMTLTQVKNSQPMTHSLVTQPLHQVQPPSNIQQIQVSIPATTAVTQTPSPATTVQLQQVTPEPQQITIESPPVQQSQILAQSVPQPAANATVVTTQTQPGQPGTKQYGMRTRNTQKQ